MSVIADIRAAIYTRLRTVTTGSPRVYRWDAPVADLGANAILIGNPTASFGKGGDPLAPDVEIGRWGMELRWPVTLLVSRTPDPASTDLRDDLIMDVIEAIYSDRTLGGTCLASALASMEDDDTDDNRTQKYHVSQWELVTTVYTNI